MKKNNIFVIIIFIIFFQKILFAQFTVEKYFTMDSDDSHNIKFSNDEKYLALFDSDNFDVIKIWDISKRQQILQLKRGDIADYCFHPNNNFIIALSENWNNGDSLKCLLNFIRIPSGKNERIIELPNKFRISGKFTSLHGIKISKDLNFLVLNYYDELYIYTFIDARMIMVEPSNDIIDLAISPDGTKIIGSNPYQLQAFDIKTGSEIWTTQEGACMPLSFTNDGSKVITGSNDGFIKYFNIKNGILVRKVQGDRNVMTPIAICPDEVFAAVGSYCLDNGVVNSAGGGGILQEAPLLLIELITGKILKRFNMMTVRELVFSSNGKYLASIAADTWNPDHFVLWRFTYQPPYLTSDIKFDDSITGGNGMLDNGEEAKLVLNIKNSGHGSAFSIIAHCSSDDSLVHIPSDIKIGAISADSTNIINIPILADKNAKKGFATIRIELTEANGNDAQPVEFEVPINRVEPPLLSISDKILINDIPQPKPLAGKPEVKSELEQLVSINGNGNRLAENDETIETVFEITNEGLGSAYGVKLFALTSHPDIKIHRPQVYVGDIAPNGKINAAIAFSTPKYFPHSTIDFVLKAVDNRASIPEVRKDIKIDFKQRYPNLILNYKIYDGTSDESRGNSNGLLDQGEIIEIAIGITNQGNFKAKNTTVDLNIDKEGIIIQKENLYLGDIDTSQTINSGSFLFTIQRRTVPGLLPLNFIIRQSDFKDEERILNLEILEEGIAKLILKKANFTKGDFLWLQVGLSDAGKIWDIIRVPNNPDIFYATTEKKGFIKSTNGGLDWTQIGVNLYNMAVKCLAIDNEHPSIIYVGTLSSGVFKTEDEGLEWKEQNKGIKTISSGKFPECLDLKVHPSNSSLLYLTTDHGIYKSTNSAKKWYLLESLAEGTITSVTLLENFSEVIYLGLSLGKLMYSMDGGSNWNTIFSSKDFSGVSSSISSIAISPNNKQSIMVGTSSGEVFHSSDAGNKWVKLNLGSISKGKISSIQFDPTSPSDIYVCNGKKVLKSDNKGNTWFDFSSAISKVGDFFAEIISIDKLGNLFAIGENGLFKGGRVENTQTFPDINFQFNSFKIKTEAYETLDKIIEQIINNPKLTVLIEGHTDNIGYVDQNQLLSEKRAESVANYLMSKGIELSRITTKGYGMNKPIASNENEKDRMKNRRVELVLVFSK